MKGNLYLIPAPLSENDFSEYVYSRLEKTVNSLYEFIVEDLKTARRILRQTGYQGDFARITFHLLNEHTPLQNIHTFLSSAEKGNNIGLMSEAGMPAIADPGSRIIKLAHQKNIPVIPLYGPCSIFLALAASGLNGQQFFFHGYLPKSQSERRKKIISLEKFLPVTQIFIETPYRNRHLLETIVEVCYPETLLCIASGISERWELIQTKTIMEWRKEKLPGLHKIPTVFLLGK